MGNSDSDDDDDDDDDDAYNDDDDDCNESVDFIIDVSITSINTNTIFIAPAITTLFHLRSSTYFIYLHHHHLLSTSSTSIIVFTKYEACS